MAYKAPIRHVAYLAAPAFGAVLARRAEPALASKPLILLDDQGRVRYSVNTAIEWDTPEVRRVIDQLRAERTPG